MAQRAQRIWETWPVRKIEGDGPVSEEIGLPTEDSEDVESVEGLRRRRKGIEGRR